MSRRCAPSPPYTLTKDEDPEHGREIDALWAMAVRMREQGAEEWPDLLLMLGDQVYADEDAPKTRAFIRERRGTDGAARRGGGGLRGVHAPLLRELGRGDDPMAPLHSAERDDLRRPRHPRRLEHLDLAARGDASEAWWHRRITGGLVGYWVYQHLGNLSPEAVRRRGLLER